MSDIFVYLDPSPPAAQQGPLAGQSVAIQANLSVRGWPTRAGSAALAGYVALEDATIIARLRQAGAVIVGAVGMSEFGFGRDGDAAGRALSEGHAGMVIMTDMLGEARLAAADAGAFGFKPTAGIVSRFGLIGLMPSLETCGLLARTPREIARAMAVIAGADERDHSMHDGALPDFLRPDQTPPLRTVGILKETLALSAADEAAAFGAGIARLAAAGLEIREVALPAWDDFALVHRIVGAVEASSSCGKFDGVRYGHRAAGAKNWNEMYLKTRAESFGPLLKSYLFQGAYFQFENYVAFEKAARVRARLEADMAALFAGVDVLALPTGQRERGGTDGIAGVYREGACTLPANVLGLPAVSVPGLVADGSPAGGLQLIGPRLSDARLLALAERLGSSQ
ncbi:MAG: amidase family protein [Smithellaceae bacterium]|nr:amidase family protein [Smithellaceae bacterium]